MRTKNNFLLLAIFLGIAVLCSGVDSQAAEPAELVTLRQEFTAQKKGVIEEELRSEIFNDYLDKLIVLESDLRLNKRDMQGVNTVRHEMRTVKKELASPTKVEPIPPLYDLAAAQAIVKKAEEEAARKAAAETAAKQAAEETARKAAAEAAAKQAAEETARKAAAETAAKQAAEEAARKAAAEVAAKQAAEETARKAAAVAAAKQAAEETARKAAAVAAAKKAAEETARKAAAVAAAKKAAEETARKAAAEAAAKKAAEESARKVAAKKAAKRTAEAAARKATAAVAAVVTAAPKPAAVAKAPAKYAASKRSGKSHVSNVQGQAAAADFSKHNVYEFDLSKVGKVSTMTFYATGRSNIDSAGKIWLITPDGRREKIGVWEVDNVSTVGASSYKDLKAHKYDISKLVTKLGTYKVEFEWTSGLGPLYIYRVELTS